MCASLDRACDPSLYEPNLGINLEVADLINQKKGNLYLPQIDISCWWVQSSRSSDCDHSPYQLPGPTYRNSCPHCNFSLLMYRYWPSSYLIFVLKIAGIRFISKLPQKTSSTSWCVDFLSGPRPVRLEHNVVFLKWLKNGVLRLLSLPGTPRILRTSEICIDCCEWKVCILLIKVSYHQDTYFLRSRLTRRLYWGHQT